jgi:HEAT repeat protein
VPAAWALSKTTYDTTYDADFQAFMDAKIAAIDARPDDWPALARLIPALGMAEAPTPETEQALLTLAFGKQSENVTAAAWLALGNLARTLGDESPARASNIVRRLLQELASPTSAGSTWQLLLALGNAGSSEALPTLERFLDEPTPDLRGAAAWALRWIDSPRADLLLTTKALRSDQEPAVRLEAVRALRCRAMTAANFAAHEKGLAVETEAAVRLALLASISDARETFPQAQRLIREVAADDPSPEIRAAAARLLGTGPVEP